MAKRSDKLGGQCPPKPAEMQELESNAHGYEKARLRAEAALRRAKVDSVSTPAETFRRTKNIPVTKHARAIVKTQKRYSGGSARRRYAARSYGGQTWSRRESNSVCNELISNELEAIIFSTHRITNLLVFADKSSEK